MFRNNNNEDNALAEEITRMLDAALDVSSAAVTHSYEVIVNLKREYLDIVFSIPVSFLINEELNSQILQILTPSLIGKLTIFPNNGPELVTVNGSPAMRFHFKRGTYRRLVFNSLDDVHAKNGIIPLMESYGFDTKGLCNAIWSGQSGLGKSTAMLTAISALKNGVDAAGNLLSEAEKPLITIIDPKMDLNLYSFSKKYKIKYVSPASSDNLNLFLSSVKDVLGQEMDEIRKRQRNLIRTGKKNKQLYLVVIDEAMSVSAMFASQSSKALKEYLSMLDMVMLQARSANCAVWISSQVITASGSAPVLSSSARSQANLKILFSPYPTQSQTQFLFTDIDLKGITVPHSSYLKGIGIASMQPLNLVVPFQSPIVRSLRND